MMKTGQNDTSGLLVCHLGLRCMFFILCFFVLTTLFRYYLSYESTLRWAVMMKMGPNDMSFGP